MRCIPLVGLVLLSAAGAPAAEKMAVVAAGDPLLAVPFGLDFLPDGSLVVADYGGHRVCKVTRDGKVSVLAGDGAKGHRDGPAKAARFNGPHNVAVTAAGDVLVSDTLNHCVRRIDGKTGEVTTVAGSPEKGFAGDGGPARDARLDQAYHVCATPDGFLVADLGNRRIRKVADGTISTIAGNGKKGIPQDLAVATEAPLVDPRAVVRDGEGKIWVLERSGNALRVVNTKGHILTAAGTGEAGPASDGFALSCALRGPKYLWAEKSGDVLIADTDNHCIRRYSPKAMTLTTVAGTGKRGKGEAGQAPTATALDQPHGVAVDRDGTIYVSDSLNKRILRIER